MRVSKKSRYGLRAMVYLANHCLKDKVCSLKKISKDEGLPFNFLEKIFSKLKKAGLINTKKGVRGGYFLAKKPSRIKVGQIIKALEGETLLVKCLKHFCPRESKCSTKDFWKKLNKAISFTLDSMTLDELIK
jgi:Rrf2 family protein